MLAQQLIQPMPRQKFGATPAVLGEALNDGINLAVWQRQLPLRTTEFALALLALGEPLAESLTIEPDAAGDVHVPFLAARYQGLAGHTGFVADVIWLVRAFACLVEARRVGLRLRVLDKAMCPRFHVDNVPLRLITTYAGAGSQWLREGVMDRGRLGESAAEPAEAKCIDQLQAGEVALFKGEKWQGNEGAGIIHRSPQPASGERRLILTLDWLA
jgi:hypothetical protein